MRRFFHSLVCLIAALHLVGGHWGILQVVAWAKMVRDYSAERGLITGVMETFDGEHPCAMCKKIAAGKQEEQKEPLPVSNDKQDNLAKWFGVSSMMTLPEPPWSGDRTAGDYPAPPGNPDQWDAQPPVPPPEWAA